MRVVSLTGATTLVDPVHGEAEAGPDGVFELPHPFAEHLLKTAAGMFRGEAEHLAQLARESLEELKDPRIALRVLADIRDRMNSLENRVAELEGGKTPADGAAEDPHVGIEVTVGESGEASNPAVPGQPPAEQIDETAPPATQPDGPAEVVSGGTQIDETGNGEQPDAAESADSAPDAAAVDATPDPAADEQPATPTKTTRAKKTTAAAPADPAA